MLPKLGNRIAKFLTKNSNYILSAASIAGMVLTVALAVKATPKAIELIEEKKEEEKTEELKPIETVKTVWKYYIPTGIATSICIVSNAISNEHCQESLIGAYAVINRYFDDYKNKVKELYGEETHQNVIDSIMKDRYARKLEKCDPPYIFASTLCDSVSIDFDDPNEETKTFYDIYSDRYFESKVSKVLEAEYHLNRNYILGSCASVNEFYEFLGIPKIKDGDNLIWNYFDGELQWIDFENRISILDDGMELYTIDMVFEPSSDCFE